LKRKEGRRGKGKERNRTTLLSFPDAASTAAPQHPKERKKGKKKKEKCECPSSTALTAPSSVHLHQTESIHRGYKTEEGVEEKIKRRRKKREK